MCILDTYFVVDMCSSFIIDPLMFLDTFFEGFDHFVKHNQRLKVIELPISVSCAVPKHYLENGGRVKSTAKLVERGALLKFVKSDN